MQGDAHIAQIHIQVLNHCYLYSIADVTFIPK